MLGLGSRAWGAGLGVWDQGAGLTCLGRKKLSYKQHAHVTTCIIQSTAEVELWWALSKAGVGYLRNQQIYGRRTQH